MKFEKNIPAKRESDIENRPERELQDKYLVMYLQYVYERVQKEKPDLLVFLDRTARPISWFLQEIMKLKKIKAPSMKYLLVGTEKGELPYFQPNIEEGLYFPFATKSVFESIKKLPDAEKLQKYYKDFCRKKVMIIDEARFSGNSGRMAAEIVTALMGEQPSNVLYKGLGISSLDLENCYASDYLRDKTIRKWKSPFDEGNIITFVETTDSNGWEPENVSQESWSNDKDKTRIVIESSAGLGHWFNVVFAGKVLLRESPSALLGRRPSQEEIDRKEKELNIALDILNRSERAEMKRIAQELYTKI